MIDRNLPKIIHQIWLGDIEPPYSFMKSVKDNHPDYDYRLWTDDNLPHPLFNQDLFDKARYYPEKADILRYELLYRFGGLYIDADIICLKPLNDLLLDKIKCSIPKGSIVIIMP